MAKKGLIAITSDIANRFPDNSSGEISPQDIRDQFTDIKDSFQNLEDNLGEHRAAPYDPSVSYKTGQACTRDGIMIFANKNTSGTFAANDWNAEPVPVNIDITGSSNIDLTGFEFSPIIILTSTNGTETINAITGGKVGMRYRFYADNGLDVDFTGSAKSGASPGQLLMPDANFILDGDGETGEWIEFSLKRSGSPYSEQGRMHYI